MTYGAFTQDFAPYECVVRSRSPLPQVALCALALVSSTGVGLWALYARQAAPAPQVAAMAPAPISRVAETPAAETPVAQTAAIPPMRAAAQKIAAASIKSPPEKVKGLLDPDLTKSYGAVVFARSMPLRSAGETQTSVTAPVAPAAVQAALSPAVPVAPAPVSPIQVAGVSSVAEMPIATLPIARPQMATPQAEPSEPAVSPAVHEVEVPLPLPRPASLAKAVPAPVRAERRAAPQMADVGAVPAAPANPSFFDKLFSRPKETSQVLAYAAPEDGLVGNVLRDTIGRPPAATDRYTAVYNITRHTVTLPDGTQLEAHSGLGAAKDNPRMVSLRMVGATPPNVYDLTQREAMFHGVRALRLTPTGGTTFGRAGLLAHTYMLRGRSGESNGCVVFRDYEAFLRAYDSGAIRRLAVVAGG